MNSRVVKSKNSPRTIIGAVLIGILVLGFIVFAVYSIGGDVISAKKAGVIVAKDFAPQPEQQITLGEEGSLRTREKAGEYTLTVEVPDVGGKKYTVWVNKERYDALEVGESFDVGPYIVPEKK